MVYTNSSGKKSIDVTMDYLRIGNSVLSFELTIDRKRQNTV